MRVVDHVHLPEGQRQPERRQSSIEPLDNPVTSCGTSMFIPLSPFIHLDESEPGLCRLPAHAYALRYESGLLGPYRAAWQSLDNPRYKHVHSSFSLHSLGRIRTRALQAPGPRIRLEIRIGLDGTIGFHGLFVGHGAAPATAAGQGEHHSGRNRSYHSQLRHTPVPLSHDAQAVTCPFIPTPFARRVALVFPKHLTYDVFVNETPKTLCSQGNTREWISPGRRRARFCDSKRTASASPGTGLTA